MIKKKSKKKAGSDRISALEKDLAALSNRLKILEKGVPAIPASLPSIASHDLTLADLLANRRGSPYEEKEVCGAIAYGGAIRKDKKQILWQMERPLPALLNLPPLVFVKILEALASEPRLKLMHALFDGPQDRQQLQKVLGVDSPGQLYHHLKELLATGIVEQQERGLYGLSPRKLVPFLVILAASYELATKSS